MNEGKRFLGAQYQFLVDEDSGTRCYSHERHLRLPGIFGSRGRGMPYGGKGVPDAVRYMCLVPAGEGS